MEPNAMLWVALLVGSIATGVCLVEMLVVRRGAETLVAAAGVATFATSAFAFIAIGEAYDRPMAAAWAFAFGVAGTGGGWALAASLLDNLVTTPPAPELSEVSVDPGRVAVIVFACAEPAVYDPRQTALLLSNLVEEDMIEVTLGTTPFMFFAQKARYRAVGGASPAESQLAAIAEQLGSAAGDLNGRVTWATCGGERSLVRVVADEVRAGAGRVVIAKLAVGDSLAMASALREVDALRLEQHGVCVLHTQPLSDSDRVLGMLVTRVISSVDSPETAGVVLVGHGQPDEYSHRNPTFDESETAFLTRARLKLIEHGVPEDNIRIAWAEWRDPDVTSAVRHLAALGSRRVSVAPATFPLDTILTRLDLELSVKQARVDGISAITLPAWKDDPAVLADLRDRVSSILNED